MYIAQVDGIVHEHGVALGAFEGHGGFAEVVGDPDAEILDLFIQEPDQTADEIPGNDDY